MFFQIGIDCLSSRTTHGLTRRYRETQGGTGRHKEAQGDTGDTRDTKGVSEKGIKISLTTIIRIHMCRIRVYIHEMCQHLFTTAREIGDAAGVEATPTNLPLH